MQMIWGKEEETWFSFSTRMHNKWRSIAKECSQTSLTGQLKPVMKQHPKLRTYTVGVL